MSDMEALTIIPVYICAHTCESGVLQPPVSSRAEVETVREDRKQGRSSGILQGSFIGSAVAGVEGSTSFTAHRNIEPLQARFRSAGRRDEFCRFIVYPTSRCSYSEPSFITSLVCGPFSQASLQDAGLADDSHSTFLPGTLYQGGTAGARFMLSRLYIKHSGRAKASSCAPATLKLHITGATDEQLRPARLKSARRVRPVDEDADQR